MSARRKYTRSMQRQASMGKKVFNTAMAAAFALNPFANIALAANDITKIDSGNGSIEVNGNVTNIYADQINKANEVGINRFNSFKVDNIANLYFKTKDGTVEVNNLLNFVNGQINVSGTVNAIKNNAIGGNLYFFSTGGMVVSGSGVINAGQLVTASVTEDYMKNIMKSISSSSGGSSSSTTSIFDKSANITKFLEQENLVKTLVADIPANSSGSISVEGKINVATAARLMAGTITTGDKSLLQSAVEFGSITNLGKSGQTLPTVTLKQSADGSISLEGVSKVDVNGTVNSGDGLGKVVIKAENSKTIDLSQASADKAKLLNWKEAQASATVNINGNVKGGDTEISAKATTKFTGNVFNAPVEEKKDDGAKTDGKTDGKAADSQETVGDKIVKAIEKTETGKKISNTAKNFFGKINVLMDESEANATVNIGKDAKVESGGQVDISATSSATNDLKITAQADVKNAKKDEKDTAKNDTISGQYLIGTAIYNKSVSNAAVNVEGEVTSTGAMNITADAANSSTVANKILKAKNASDSTQYMDAVVNVVADTTTAAVNIKEGSTVTSSDAITMAAKTDSSLDVTGNVVTDNNAAAATALNIVASTTDAAVNIDSEVKGKSVEADAANKVSKLNITTSNAYEKASEAKKEETKPDDTTKDDKKNTNEAAAANEAGTTTAGGDDSSSGSGTDGSSDDSEAAPGAGEGTEDYGQEEGDNVIDIDPAPPASSSSSEDTSAAEGLSELLKGDSSDSDNDSGILGANKDADNKKSATSGDAEAVKDAKGTKDTDQAKDAENKSDSSTDAEKKKAEDKETKKTGWNQYFDIGASVMVGNFTNNATAKVGKTGSLTATGGDVTIKSDVEIAKGDIKVTNSIINTDAAAKFAVGAAVGVKNMHNDAAIVLENADSTQTAVKAASGGVNMAATVSNQAAAEKTSSGSTDSTTGGSSTTGGNTDSSTTGGSTDGNTSNGGTASNGGTTGDSTSNGGSTSDSSKTETTASGSMVVQSTMSSAVKKDDKDKDKDTNLPFAASGTVAIENTTSNANIYVGKNEKIEAGKKASLTATLKGEDKLEAGKANKDGKAETTTSGAQVAVGGTAAVQNSYLNSKIEIASGAAIEAGHIDAKSTNTITNTVTSVGGVTTSKGGVDGMVAYMGGESNARVLVDNGASLTAKYTKAESTTKGDATGGSTTTDTTTNGTATNDASTGTTTDDKKTDTSASKDNSTDGKISLETENKTTLTNKAGLTDKSDYVAVGASVGVVSYDLLSETKITGSDTAKQGTITAVELSAEATNDSTVKNSTVAGVTAGKSAQKKDDKSKDDKKADTKSSNDDASGTTLKVRDEKKSEGSDSSEKVEDIDKYSINSEGKEDKESAAKVEDPAPAADSEVAKDKDGNADTQDKKKTEEQKKSNSTVNIAAAGSVSWNDVKTNAIAEIANVKIVGSGSDGNNNIIVSASDDSTIKASSGASTLIEAGKEGDTGFSASLAGAVAGNDVLKTTRAKISGVTMFNMDSVINTAENNGTVWATGKSVGTGKKAAAGLTAVTSADVNYVTSNVDAIIENSNINTNETEEKEFEVENQASTMDTQIAGGLAYEKTKTTVAAGASVTINKLTNNINAKMTNGKIGNDKANAQVTNQAITKLDQVGVASSIGVAEGGAYLNANAAVAANTVKNNIDATIDGTTIYADGKKVVVLAKDGKVDDTAFKKYEAKIKELKEEGYDAEASDVTEAVNDDAEVEEENKQSLTDKITTTVTAWALEKYMELQNQGGNRIVTGALGLGITKNAAKSGSDSDSGTKAASNGSLTAAASVAYSDITNNVTANIKNANIKATAVEANANTDSLMIDAAVGASVATTGKGMTAAGSVAIQNLNNDTKALVENSTITTSQADVLASNNSLAVTSAGQASGTNGALALGMGWAQNDIDNITSARINGSTINALDDTLGTDLDVKADNQSKIYAVGIAAGVATGGETAGAVIDGAFAGNTGTNSTEAVIEQDSKNKTKINKANKVAVEAKSETTQKAIAGNASVKTGSSKFNAAIGGAVAINKLGSSSEHQSVKAAINNAEITTVKASKTTTDESGSTTTKTINPSISVNALDNDTLMNVAVGGAVKAGGNGVSVQGSVALSKLYKDSTATMDKASIKSASTTEDNATVAVDAQSTGKITNSASGVSVSVGGDADVSAMAGVAVNNLEGTTKAAVTNSTQNMKDLSVKADSKREILNVGVGAETAVGSKAAVAVQGNVAVNKLDNDVQAEISGSTIEATNNVAVQANNTNVLKNYGGSLNVAVSGTAGVGVGATVAVNTIEGDTKALVSGSNIKALGQDADDTITTKEYAQNSNSKGNMTSTEKKRKGLVVSADSQQTLKNVSVTAGVSAAATAAVGANATVAVNKVAGETQALLENTNVNQNLAAGTAAGDVAVLAHDSTEVNSTVGTLGVSGASTAAVAAGAAVDTNNFSRNTTAAIKGASDKNQAAINAKDLAVKSASSADLTLVEQGASVAIGATAGVAAVGTVSVNNFSGTTKSVVENAKVNTANDAAVEADTAKKSKISLGAYAVSGGYAAVSASAGVSVLNDNSTTQAALKNAEITSAAKDVQIAANNVSNLSNLAANVNVAVGIGAGVGTAVTVNNMNNTVATSLDSSVVTAKKGKAQASANNEMELHSTNAASSSGLGAVGVGVAVNNINSSTATTLTNSGIHADTIDIKADEKRTIDAQTVGLNVGAVAVGTNVNINNIGTTMAKEYSYGDGLKYSTEQITTKINDALESSEKAQADVAKSGYTMEASVASEAANSSSQVQGVSISMNQDVLQATNDVNIATNAITNATVNMVGVTGSLAGVNVTVGVTDIKHNNQVAISNRSQISGGKVNISASSGGTIDQTVQQAGLAGGSVNVGVSKLLRSGENTINISGGTVTASRDVDGTKDANASTAKTTQLDISVSDAAVLNNTVDGFTAALGSAGALVTNTEDKTNNTINITNGAALTSVEKKTVNVDIYDIGTDASGNKTQLHSQDTEVRPEYKNINITANSTTQANATTNVTSIAGVSGHGDFATAVIGDENHGSANTTVNIGTNNKFYGGDLNVTSENKAAATAKVDANIIGAATGQGSTSNASVYGSSNTTVNNGNEILADNINLQAINGMKAAADTAGVGVSGLGININQANAVVDGKTSLSVGNVSLKSSTWQEDEGSVETVNRTDKEEPDYLVKMGKGKEVIQDKGGALKLVAQDNSQGTANIKGVSVGAIGSGTNLARTTAKSTVDVNVIVDTMKAKSLDIQAGSSLMTVATADGRNGGVATINPRAASVENKSDSTTNVKLMGKFNLDENFRGEAINADKTGIMVNALEATVAGGSGTAVENNINQNSYMDISSASITAGGTVEAGSGNKYTLYAAGDNNKYLLRANGIGIVGNVQINSITNTVNNTAETKLGNVTSDGDQKYWADTDNDIASEAYAYAGSSIAGGTGLNNTLNLNSNNNISQASGKLLKTLDSNSNITIAANDQEKISNKAMAENSGTVGGVSATSKNTITRNNKLDLAGNIYSRKDVNLYAGKSVNNVLGNLQLDTAAEVYNHSLIPLVFDPTVTNQQNQNNIINISGKVQSVQDANLYADAGKEIFSNFTGKFTGYGGKGTPTYVAKTNGKYNVDDHGTEVASKTYDNHVNVTGSVTAGVASDQSITIGETGWVLLTPEQFKQCAAYYSKAKQEMPDNYYAVVADADYASTMAEYGFNSKQIKKLSDVVKINDPEAAGINVSNFTLGTYSYAESLVKRLSELSQLMAEYSQAKDSSQTAAFVGYQAEYERVAKLLNNSGLLDDKGNVVKDVAINYIDIPDLAASGGNINVITDDLYGSGSLTAKGTPSIKVTNNTNLAMNVNDVTVSNPGGQVFFNNNAMEKKEEIAAANRNKDKTIGSLSVAKGAAGSVEITSNLNPAASIHTDTIHFKIDDEDIQENRENPIKADINIAGSITAQGGDVTVRNHNFDISIYSGGSSAHAISAKNIYLIADKGSLTQSYTEGISNVGGDPKDKYNDYWNTDKMYDGTTGEITAAKEYTDNSHAGDIQGDNIFLNASDVNINGFVQSGYDNYYVSISKTTKLTDGLQLADSTDTTSKMTVEKRMEEIAKNNKANDLSNSSVLGNDSYCLVKGGARYNSEKKYYEYVVPVYYNPVTGELLTPDVESKGGNITITGRISSTGAGNIICLDGASDININSTLDNTLITSKLVTNDVEGRIRLNDTGRGFATEITRGDSDDALNYKIYSLYTQGEKDKEGYVPAGTLLYDSSDKGWNGVAADGKAYLTKGDDNKITYTPKEGLRYNWTTGKQTGTTNTYTKTYYNSWWGLSDSESDLKTDLVNVDKKTAEASSEDAQAKTDGSYIGTSTDGNINNITLYVIKNHTTSEHSIKIIEQKKWSQGFLGCHKYTMTRWTDTWGEDFANNYSLKADNPIGIKFIGSASGQSNVNISTNGNLEMAGDIGNKNLYTTTDANGDIASRLEKGTVTISSTNGNIIQTGGSIYGADVALSAAGNMQNINITAGDNLNLSAVNVAGNLSKNIDILVDNNRGSLGDVVLTGAGLADNDSDGLNETATFKLTTNGKSGNIKTGKDKDGKDVVINAERIDLISSNGTIEANVNAGQQPIGSDTLSASVNAQAKGNITLTQAKGNMRVGRIYSNGGDVTVNVNQGSVVDALPYGTLEADDENSLLEKWRSMGLLGDETSAADKAMAEAKSNVEKKLTGDDNATYNTWDKNTLLYTVSDSILNQTTDTLPKTSTKDPNLKGNNITINVAESAGLDSDKVTTINSSQLTDVDKLKALSKADGSTVTVTKGANDTVDFNITQRLPIGVQTNNAEGKLTIGKITTNDEGESTVGKAEGNAYIQGRVDSTDNNANKDLALNTIQVTGNVSIESLGNIINGSGNSAVQNIIAQNLNLTAANKGSIGTLDNYITTDLGSTAGAGIIRAVGNGIYINNTGANNIALKAISSSENIDIAANGDILMTAKQNLEGVAETYLQVENEDNTITLTSRKGSVGSVSTTADGEIEYDENGKPKLNGIRIKNSENGKTKVTIEAAKDVAVEGISNDPTGKNASGYLNLTVNTYKDGTTGDKKLDNIAINVNGTLLSNQKLEANKTISINTAEKLEVGDNVNAGKEIYLGSNKQVNLNKGTLEATKVNIQAGTDLNQAAANSIKAATSLTAKSGSNMSLKGINEAGAATLTAGGDIAQASTGKLIVDNKLTATADKAITLNGTNKAGDAAITAGTDITQGATGTLDVANKVEAVAKTAAVTLSGSTKANEAAITAGTDMKLNGNLVATNKADLTAGKDMSLNGSVETAVAKLTAGKNLQEAATAVLKANELRAESTGDLVLAGTANEIHKAYVDSKRTADGTEVVLNNSVGDLEATVTNSLDKKSQVKGSVKITNTAKGGKLLVHDIAATQNINMASQGDADVSSINAGKDINVNAANDVNVAGNSKVDGAYITLSGGNNVNVNENTKVNGDNIDIQAAYTATLGNNVEAKANQLLNVFANNLNVGNSVKLTGADLNINVGNDVVAGNSVTMTGSNKLSLTVGNNIEAGNNLTATSNKAASIQANNITVGNAATFEGKESLSIVADNSFNAGDNLTAKSDKAVTIEAGSSIAVGDKANLNSQGTLKLQAGTDITLGNDSKVEGKNKLTINATKGNVSVGNKADIDGAATEITAGQNVTLGNNSTVDGTDITFKGGNNVSLNEGTKVNGTNITVKATKDATLGNSVEANASKLLNVAANNINVGNSVKLTGAELNVNADTNIGAGNNVTMIGVDKLTVNAKNNIGVGNDVTMAGSDQLHITAGNDLNAGDKLIVTSDKEVTVQANNINVGNTATLEGTEGLIITAGNNIEAGANLTATSEKSATLQANNITVGNNANLQGGESLAITAAGNINAGAEVILHGGNSLNINAGGSVTTGVSGSLTSGKDLSITAGQNVTTGDSGSLISGKELSIAVGNDVTLGKSTTMSSGSTLSIKAEKGNIDTNDKTNIHSDGDLVLETANRNVNYDYEAAAPNYYGEINLDGTEVSSNKTIKITAGTDLDIGTTDTKRESSIYSKDGVTIDVGHKTYNSGSITTEKDIVITSGNEISNQVGSSMTANNITMTSESHIANASDINATGDVNIESKKGSVTNGFAKFNEKNGEITEIANVSQHAKNFNITAKNDFVSNYADMVATEDVTITGEHVVGLSKGIAAGGDILIDASDGNMVNNATLISTGGDVTLKSHNGSILNGAGGDILTLGGNVNLYANAVGGESITVYDEVKKEYVTIENGSVVNLGDIMALDATAKDKDKAGTIRLVSEHADVINRKNINSIGGSDGNASKEYTYNGHSYTVAVKNLEMLAKEGELYTDKDTLAAGGYINLAAKTGLNSLGKDIYAGGDITLEATEGNMVNTAQIESANGSVTLKADKGTIVNTLTGDIVAGGGSVLLHAGAETEASHQIYALGTDGSKTTLDVTLPEGLETTNIKAHKYYKSDTTGKYVAITNDTNINGLSPTELESIVTNAVYVDNDGNDVALQSKDAITITVDGEELYVLSGNIEFVRQGDVLNRGDLVAMGTTTTDTDKNEVSTDKTNAANYGTITLKSDHGNVTNYDDFAKVDGQSEYLLAGDHAKDAIYTGNATKKYMLANGNITLEAPEGAFYNDLSFKTDASVTLAAKDNIQVGKTFTYGEVGQDLNITSTEGKVLADETTDVVAGNNVNVNAATGVDLKGTTAALNGSVNVANKHGKVNMGELQANDTAKVDTGFGDIVIGTIGADKVIVTSQGANSYVDIDDLTTGSYVGIRGDYINNKNDKVLDVQHGDSYAGTVTFDIDGYNGNQVKGNLQLENAGHSVFDTLHITDAQVNITDNGKLDVNKTRVHGNALFQAMGSNTAIFGTMPKAYKAHFAYADKNDWMNFYVLDGNHQSSNGILVHHDTYHYVDNQRYSAETLSFLLLDYKAAADNYRFDSNPIKLFNRYNVYETYAFQVPQAQEDDEFSIV